MLYGHSLPLPLTPALPLFMPFLFLMLRPSNSLRCDDSLLHHSRPSFPHFLLPLLLSSSAMPYYSLSSSPVWFYVALLKPPTLHSPCPRLSVCSLVSLCCLFSVPNHFALPVFQGAATLTGDMEVHLPRHEQPSGINSNHQFYNMPMSPGWGLKPKRRGIIFFP